MGFIQMTFKQIHHFGLVITDMDASIAWYKEKLGFELEKRWRFPEVPDLEFAHIRSGNVRLELFENKASAPSPDEGADVFGALSTQGAKHVGLLVDDIDTLKSELEEKGVELISDIMTVEPVKVRNLFIKDNSGNQLEFDQPF